MEELTIYNDQRENKRIDENEMYRQHETHHTSLMPDYFTNWISQLLFFQASEFLVDTFPVR
jgi:hypothetical protein